MAGKVTRMPAAPSCTSQPGASRIVSSPPSTRHCRAGPICFISPTTAARFAPGKENCLVLDFAGNVRRHGPVDAVSVMPKSGAGDGSRTTVEAVRAKECPDCEALAALNASTCKVCGHEWPRQEKPKHEASAEASVGILSSEAVPPQMVPVVDWQMRRWQKPGSPDSVRVDYLAGLNRYSEWVCPEHAGYAGRKATDWWVRHGGAPPFPRTTDEALERQQELRMPATILIRPRGKYFDVVGRSFRKEQEDAAWT